MARNIKRKLSKKEQKAASKVASFDMNKKLARETVPDTEILKKEVFVSHVISVKDFADRAGLPVTSVIASLMKNGVLATINESIDFETASIIGDELNLDVKEEADQKKVIEEKAETKEKDKNLIERPPVVTIMGHVDHGKTTLLDNIRKSQVAESESGGITQHISAYQVRLKESKNKDLLNRKITFIDTPGHAAFSAMREHGAAITDIVVLIVAADDGVMPQTAEVIKQAKENHVPIIVAINKIDLPGADIMKVKQQLSEYELIPEEWGGKTTMVEISAKSGLGIDNLLEMILLQSDMMEIVANPKEKAIGVVIESHMEKGTGATALVLIENGTVKVGDSIAIGSSYGRVRILEKYNRKSIKEAGPSSPVYIAGLKSLPSFGDKLLSFDTEKDARENALKAEKVSATINIATARRINSETSENVSEKIKIVELNIILKADVGGSLEAIKKSILEIHVPDLQIKIIADGVGPISESDATLAKATNAIIFGFRVKVLGAAKKIAETEKIEIRCNDIIYELISDLKRDAEKILPLEIIEEELGSGEVLAIFRDDRKGFVAGGIVNKGKISVNDEIKIFQRGNEKYRAKILSLRKEKNEAKEVESGTECGFSLPAGANIAVGDTFVTYKTIQKERVIN